MPTFAIVAVRLIGLWMIAGSIAGLMIVIMVVAEGHSLSEMWGDQWAYQLTVAVSPAVVGLSLILFSRPISALVSRGVSTTQPDGLTACQFTRVGVFLLGLFALLNSVPFVVSHVFGGMTVSLNYWLLCGFGVVLVLASSSIGGWIKRIQNQS